MEVPTHRRRHRRRRYGAVPALVPTAFALAAVALAAPAWAAPGDLDPSFSGDGMQTTDFGPGGDGASAVAVRADGKIVAAGSTEDGSDVDFALVRYNADGSPDPSFGSGGTVTTDFDPGSSAASDMALQADGKIVVAGGVRGPGNIDFALARYNADGSLDPSFGVGGKVTTNFGRFSSSGASGVALQPDGKIVAAGRAFVGPSDDFAMARYNPDGSLDLSFGVLGKVTTDFGGGDEARGVAVEPGGKIVLAGCSGPTSCLAIGAGGDFALARYNPDGSLDAGDPSDPTDDFGVGGKVTTDFGATEEAFGVALQIPPALVGSPRIVVVGRIVRSTIDTGWALARYDPDGSLDRTFSGDGLQTTDIGGLGGAALAVAVQADGKTVVAGGRGFALARYNRDGSLDVGFGAGGTVTTNFPTGGPSGASAVALQADGKIVAAGGAAVGLGMFDSVFAVARYQGGEGTPLTDSDADGMPDGSDNCAGVANPSQQNTDGDAEGDACDADDDNDGVPDASDGCPTEAAATPNGCPLVAPADADGDGVLDDVDMCPAVAAATPNGCPPPGPAPDADRDGVPDAMDGCPTVPAATGDGCPPAATAALRASAARLTQALRRAGIRGVLRRRGASFGFTAPAAGVFRGRITMTVPSGGVAAARRVTVLTGTRTFPAAGKGTVKLKLARQGRRVLKRARRATLRLSLSFVDVADRTFSASKTVRLRR